MKATPLTLKKKLALELWREQNKLASKEHPLRQLFWECTLRCDLKCRHCGSDCKMQSESKDMPKEDFLRVLDGIAKKTDPHKVFVIISVNTVLMQLYLFFSYFMDGFAYAGEALGGRAYGAKNTTAFRETLRRLWIWTLMVTIGYTLLYIGGGRWIVSLLTDEPQVLEASRGYLWWSWLIPAAGCVAFIWDGVFIGLTATRGMLASSFVSAFVFFAVYLLTQVPLGNHGLWLAMVVYLAMRGILQTIWYRLRIFNGI